MENPHKYNPIIPFSLIFLFLFCALVPVKAYSQAECAKGIAVPPFLGEGLDPDLLLIIDNSGSMLDLAYVDPDRQCLDDTYNSSEVYAGYFENDIYYYYHFATGRFVRYTGALWQDVFAACGASSDTYYRRNTGVGLFYEVYVQGCVDGAGDLTGVVNFVGRGNFLNWAASSKLDIQKKILTGGKYDPATGQLIMESRGCGARRHAKKVEVTRMSTGLAGYDLNIGISPPPEWRPGKNYAPGDMVRDKDKYFITNAGGVSCGTDILTDICVNWVPTDISLTHMEIFKITSAANAIDWESCEDVMDELAKVEPDKPNLGTIITETSDCLGFAANNTLEGYSNAALNHSLQNCWYLQKFGEWQPGEGSVSSIMNICEHVYDDLNPWDITENESGYVCYGVWDADPSLWEGYVGRCWDPGGAAVKVCIKFKPSGECLKWGWVGGADPGWIVDPADPDAAYNCIDQALKDFCGVMEVPEVIDPSDLVGDTPATEDTLWNIPAILIGAAMGTNLGEPIAVLKGLIVVPQPPTGLIHEFADSIRMGAMIFNDSGSESECAKLDVFAQDDCGADPGDADGGKIISYIDQSPAHTIDLVTAINDIKATSWTPLAEAMYNAIGYYTQNAALCLNPGADFVVGNDPVQAYCQHKNILIITEGSSTADLNAAVKTFAEGTGKDLDNTDGAQDCGILAGSTYLDDLTYYAQNGNLFPPPPPGEEIRNIFTHIVVSGTLRDLGDDECSPDVLLENAATQGGTSLYNAADPAMLEITLRNLFFALSTRASAGSAASVISSSRGGEGATYQAIFWPRAEFFEGGLMKEITWTGEVHALLVDAYGRLYEDTNENSTLDLSSDERVVFYFDVNEEKTKACYGEMNPDGTCNGTTKGLKQVRYLWSAAEWLMGITPTESVAGIDILLNRNQYISTEKKRRIFTWNDLNNDGIVANGEMLDFVPRDWGDALLSPADALAASRGQVPLDFGLQTSDEVNEIVRWIRGQDQMGLRSRRVPHDLDHDGIDETFVSWRLGDVIHSTPMSVSSPSEGLHLLYKDNSYSAFVSKYKKRRHMIYFGGNDGMLHAVNGGFYDENATRFCRNADCTDEDVIAASSPELGAELWAYVPYNLLPHLKCLTQDGYAHKYFVDQRVRIADVRIFPDDATHINGWGTILVGAMGLGGAKIEAESLPVAAADGINDKREFTSAYFVFDITDPEQPPTLLGEMTRTTEVDAFGADVDADLAHTLPIPTIVTMKDGPDASDTTWYLMLGSGPTEVNGTSTQDARLAVMPLNLLVDKTAPFRIPDSEPDPVNDERGRFLLDPNSFISDLITVDFELKPNYKADAVYFGTVSGTWGGWGGKLYRLVTRKLDAFTGDQESTIPSQWSSLINPMVNPVPLIDVNKPITASPTVAYDGKNYWIYFGTGRFFDINDKSDATQQTYYGIKEPMSFAGIPSNCIGTFTWETVEEMASGLVPGSLGLTPVGDIRVGATSALLRCVDGTTDCLPREADGITPLPNFDALEDYIAGTGTGCDAADLMGTDGWYKDFPEPRERNLGQAALLGGLLSFTTYQPYNDICLSEGMSILYGVAYKTGTAYYPDVFGVGPDPSGNVVDRIELGKGLAITPNLHVGKGMGTKAFVQTSTGAIVEIPQPGTPSSPGTGLTGWTDD